MSDVSRFHKLHGLGNDFLVAFVQELPAQTDASRTAAALCDRRRGVGADGLIYATLNTAGEGSELSADMCLWNSDGSSAEMSGNGLRCLAHAVAHTRRMDSLDIVVRTAAGSRRCSIRSGDVPGTTTGTVEMGELRSGPRPDVAGSSPAAVVERFLGVGAVQRYETMQIGNPHVVFAVADPRAVPLMEAGPALQALFTGGVNVHFGAVTGVDEVTLRVWERGAGATDACGTGAVAAAAVFRRWGVVGHDVVVRMVGGDARVDLSDPVTLTAESTYVAAITMTDE